MKIRMKRWHLFHHMAPLLASASGSKLHVAFSQPVSPTSSCWNAKFVQTASEAQQIIFDQETAYNICHQLCRTPGVIKLPGMDTTKENQQFQSKFSL